MLGGTSFDPIFGVVKAWTTPTIDTPTHLDRLCIGKSADAHGAVVSDHLVA